MSVFNKAVLLALILGGLNGAVQALWGLDVLAWLGGGAFAWPCRAAYSVIGLAAVCALPMLASLPPERDPPEPNAP